MAMLTGQAVYSVLQMPQGDSCGLLLDPSSVPSVSLPSDQCQTISLRESDGTRLTTAESGPNNGVHFISRDLALAVRAGDIAPTLQFALDNWAEATPALEQRSADLSTGNCSDTFEFEPAACAAPLPRAYHWADGSAYVTHVELVRKARGAELPESFWTDPLIYMGASDAFIGSRDHIEVESEDWGIDFEAEVVVITDDVPAGVSPEQAGEYIRLVGLGRVVGKQATEQGIARAKETGMCCVALGNASHLGRIGKFGERCADKAWCQCTTSTWLDMIP